MYRAIVGEGDATIDASVKLCCQNSRTCYFSRVLETLTLEQLKRKLLVLKLLKLVGKKMAAPRPSILAPATLSVTAVEPTCSVDPWMRITES